MPCVQKVAYILYCIYLRNAILHKIIFTQVFMKKLLPLLILLLVAGVVACVRDRDEERAEENVGLSVSEARDYFDRNAEALNLPSLLLPGTGIRTRGEHVHGPDCDHDHEHTRSGELPGVVLTPHWRKATAYRTKEVDIVDAPVLLNTEMVVRRHDMA